MKENIRSIDKIIEEVQEEDDISFPEPLDDPIDRDKNLNIIDNDSTLSSQEARDLLERIDAGIEKAERGIDKYFYSSPKRAVEFQQNHIAYLELKAKILKLIGDSKNQPTGSFNQTNNIVIGDKSIDKIKDVLVSRLYGGNSRRENS